MRNELESDHDLVYKNNNKFDHGFYQQEYGMAMDIIINDGITDIIYLIIKYFFNVESKIVIKYS